MQSQISWKDFKEAAAAKAGLASGSAVSFFWEGCQIEESDDKGLGLIAKDGDTLVLVPDLKPEHSVSSHGTITEAVSECGPDPPPERQDHEAPKTEAMTDERWTLTSSATEEISMPEGHPQRKRPDRSAQEAVIPASSHSGSDQPTLGTSTRGLSIESTRKIEPQARNHACNIILVYA